MSISGKAWHSVAIDEAHEMLINKDLKTSIVHPNKDFISKQAIYFPIRAKAMKTLRKELDIELEPQETKTNPKQSLYSKMNDNIKELPSQELPVN